ncbi:MAG: DNA gyrase subunit A [Casimicrobiaceae bacterium]|nr:DNA gyrase subunit A [Casimicrobiaceae bacterium]MDW8312512.1 DNA gyrase subunit A [Burkholderiales bacterium]
MDSFAKETVPISLEAEMRSSYLDYAMSVIVARALPDVRDGLKPVHRRVLYGMHEANNTYNRPYVKCARVVGDVMGKYHPHGDAAIYDTLVRMAQDFSLRYPLVDGQGNFGSVDGDNAAAMRYTECRLERISAELLSDLDKETVDFQPNYDGKEREPTVLPAKFPNLLVNGASGIAVGMATSIPPHNLAEVIDATLLLLKKPEASIDELIRVLPAPDFPTGGYIYGLESVHQGYRTGRGRVIIRAKTHVEQIGKSERQAIVVDEIPYQVNKAALLQKIGELVRDKKIEGISDLRDESDKSGMRIVIELKRGEIPDIVLNNLYKNTQLQDSFSINTVALVDGRPRTLNLKELLEAFLEHRREVVTRRTRYELRQARAKGHILEGLAVALENVDAIIETIKQSASPEEAQNALTSRLWQSSLVKEMVARAGADFLRPEEVGPEACWQDKEQAYRLTVAQAKAILEMRLQRLTALESDKVFSEYKEIIDTVRDLLDILAKPERVTKIIATELGEIKKQFGDARRSEIVLNAEETSIEDLIKPQDMVVTLTHGGYIKAQPVEEYRAQKRGGRGKQATATKEEDFVERLFIANTHDTLLCFSNRGRVYWLKVYEVPEGGRSSRGKPIVNLFPLADREKITAVVAVKDFDPEKFIFMATSMGTVKKTSLEDFSRPKKSGIIAVDLNDGDYLIGAALTDGKHDVMLFSDGGKAVRFDENDVRPMGRNARGVRGMMLEPGQRVIAMLVADDEEQQVLTATENGYGKRTPIVEYTRHGRGTKGMIAIDQSGRNGKVVAATLVRPQDEVMLITTSGVLIRTKVASIRESGRNTKGVTLIKLDDGVKLSGIERIAEPEDEGEEEPGTQGELL